MSDKQSGIIEEIKAKIKEIDDEIIREKDGTFLEEGYKDDSGKARMDLLSWESITSLADVLAYGADKYEERNWEKGILFSRVFAAAHRHLAAWWTESNDDWETGLNHLDHARCCLMFLRHYQHYEEFYADYDDRPKLPAKEEE